jgi:hypothetical protein
VHKHIKWRCRPATLKLAVFKQIFRQIVLDLQYYTASLKQQTGERTLRAVIFGAIAYNVLPTGSKAKADAAKV